MPFLLLLVLSLACLQREWPRPPIALTPVRAGLVTWLGTGILIALTGLLAALLRRWVLTDPHARPQVVRRFSRLRRYALFAHLGWFLTALFACGWGWAVKSWLTAHGTTLPGVELVLLTPLLAALVLSWALYYDVDAALKRTAAYADDTPPPGRWAQVLLQARHNFLLLAPPLLLTFVQQTVVWCFPALLSDQLLLGLFAIGLLAAVFVGIPWLLRLLLGLRPLPPGPLRDRLLATAKRLHFRCNDILLWDTRNTVANAMVTGPLPFLRYVVLSDRLIKEMTPEEVEAVFGHEVGHIKHHHLLFYFGFLIASMFVVFGAWTWLTGQLDHESVQQALGEPLPDVAAWLRANELLALLPMLLLLAGYVFVVFGFLSRRCERQADIFGCQTVSCAVFISALEKVAWLNGISRDRPGWLSSWQHSTIARRVEFLERMSTDPALAARFQWRVGLVKWGVVIGLGAALTGMLVLVPEQVWAILRQM